MRVRFLLLLSASLRFAGAFATVARPLRRATRTELAAGNNDDISPKKKGIPLALLIWPLIAARARRGPYYPR